MRRVRLSNKQPKRGRGRPRKHVDYDLARRLGKICCSIVECAAVMGVSEARLRSDPKFMEAYSAGYAEGCASLRRKQMQLALAGNTRMLIWLGKQLLGQYERYDVHETSGINEVTRHWMDRREERLKYLRDAELDRIEAILLRAAERAGRGDADHPLQDPTSVH